MKTVYAVYKSTRLTEGKIKELITTFANLRDAQAFTDSMHMFIEHQNVFDSMQEYYTVKERDNVINAMRKLTKEEKIAIENYITAGNSILYEN